MNTIAGREENKAKIKTWNHHTTYKKVTMQKCTDDCSRSLFVWEVAGVLQHFTSELFIIYPGGVPTYWSAGSLRHQPYALQFDGYWTDLHMIWQCLHTAPSLLSLVSDRLGANEHVKQCSRRGPIKESHQKRALLIRLPMSVWRLREPHSIDAAAGRVQVGSVCSGWGSGWFGLQTSNALLQYHSFFLLNGFV